MRATSGCGCGSCRAGLPCDCCVGTQVMTPVEPCNRPGLEAIEYRVGNWGRFLETMKARLATVSIQALQPDGQTVQTERPLAGLTTRASNDFGIALLDAAAVMGDVLTFYQERVANEGYLRTATERRSVLELARLVGYAPRPGVAASVYLAYTIDDKQTAPVMIPAGARAQSVPGPGETPQTFETAEPLEARAAWNEFKLRKVRPQTAAEIAAGTLYLKGITTGLRVNDPLLIGSGSGQPMPFRVTGVVSDASNGRTKILFLPWGDMGAAPLPIAATAATTATHAGGTQNVADPVIELTRQLTLAASIPPRNALALSRDLGSTFAARADIGAQIVTTFLPQLSLTLPIALAASPATPKNPIRVHALRQRTGLFGSNLAGTPSYARDGDTGMITITGYTAPTIDSSFGSLNDPRGAPLRTVALAGEFERIAPQSWVLIDRPSAIVPGAVTVHLVDAVRSTTLSAFGAATRSTLLTLEVRWMDEPGITNGQRSEARTDERVLRGSVVYAESEELELADAPIMEDLCGGGSGDWIELEGYHSDLKAGRWVIVSGERADVTTVDPTTGKTVAVHGVQASERVMLSNVVQAIATATGEPVLQANRKGVLPAETLHTFVQFSKDLSYCYVRGAVKIYANVVKATHGETQMEVLGNGDGARPLQSFALKKPPLTFVAAPTAEGAESTLHAYVNEVQWHETGSLAWLGAQDRGFVTLTDDAGATTLRFGNGERGARVPTGLLNVRAVYRSGIGSAGNVGAGQISQLQTRPLGVKEVINPARASGGADREARDLARENAPLSVMPLDRLVSVQDYADFTRRFAGVGKAVARRASDGRREIVFITIAGVDDIPIDKTSDLYRNLLQALLDLGDAELPLRVERRELKMLVLAARIRVATDHVWDTVVTAVRARLLETFGFGRRALGQGVRLSEVMAAIQGVKGVEYADIDTFGAISETVEDTHAGKRKRREGTPDEVLEAVQDLLSAPPGNALPADVDAWPGGPDGGVLRPAELAVFSPAIPGTLLLNQIS